MSGQGKRCAAGIRRTLVFHKVAAVHARVHAGGSDPGARLLSVACPSALVWALDARAAQADNDGSWWSKRRDGVSRRRSMITGMALALSRLSSARPTAHPCAACRPRHRERTRCARAYAGASLPETRQQCAPSAGVREPPPRCAVTWPPLTAPAPRRRRSSPRRPGEKRNGGVGREGGGGGAGLLAVNRISLSPPSACIIL